VLSERLWRKKPRMLNAVHLNLIFSYLSENLKLEEPEGHKVVPVMSQKVTRTLLKLFYSYSSTFASGICGISN